MQIYEIISKNTQNSQDINHGFSITLHPKFAEIWNVEIPEEEVDIIVGDFSESLRRMYELEYKYYMLKKRPFKGVEQRRVNMVNRLELELIAELDEIKPMLLESLEKWLDAHAITDPEQWADARVRSNEERGDRHFAGLIYEYVRYTEEFPTLSQMPRVTQQRFNTLLQHAIGNDGFPILNQVLGQYYLQSLLQESCGVLTPADELQRYS